MSRGFIISLTALSLIMMLPLWGMLAFKWPISTDLIFYAISAKEFSSQFWSGEIYPRWLTNTNAGFGSPVFLFYSPLTFYVMSLFEFIAPIDSHGFGRIFIGLTLSIPLAGITSYRWLHLETDKKTAEKGALIYAGFPYLLLHMYSGFAIAQLWGIALFPFLLEAAHGVIKKGWRATPKLALAYAALCATHLPSMLMFAGVPFLYVLVFSPVGKRIFMAILAAGTALLGTALAAICLLPALLNKEYITTEHFLDGRLGYANDFLDTYSKLGLVSVILPLILFYIELPKAARRSILTKPFYFWVAVQAGFLFMTLPLSKPLWDALPPLQHLQFPFRFFLAMLPGTVFIALQLLPYIKSRNTYKVLFVVGWIAVVCMAEDTGFYKKTPLLTTILDNHLLARPEYQTRWMEKADIDFRLHVPEQFIATPLATIMGGKGSASILEQDSRTIRLHADITSPQATVVLRRFYFPGWEITPTNLVISPQDSLISLHLPKGRHDITIRQPWFAGEREGMAISIAALMALLILYVSSYLKRAENGRINTF